MKSNKIQDERVLSARRQIQSDAFQILALVLILATLIQQIAFQAPFSQYAVEFFCWIGCGFYVSIRNFKMGIEIGTTERKNNKTILKGVFLSGLLSVFFFVVFYGENNANNLMLFFICFIGFNFLFQFFIRYINEKKQKQIESKMSADEMNE